MCEVGRITQAKRAYALFQRTARDSAHVDLNQRRPTTRRLQCMTDVMCQSDARRARRLRLASLGVRPHSFARRARAARQGSQPFTLLGAHRLCARLARVRCSRLARRKRRREASKGKGTEEAQQTQTQLLACRWQSAVKRDPLQL